MKVTHFKLFLLMKIHSNYLRRKFEGEISQLFHPFSFSFFFPCLFQFSSSQEEKSENRKILLISTSSRSSLCWSHTHTAEAYLMKIYYLCVSFLLSFAFFFVKNTFSAARWKSDEIDNKTQLKNNMGKKISSRCSSVRRRGEKKLFSYIARDNFWMMYRFDRHSCSRR